MSAALVAPKYASSDLPLIAHTLNERDILDIAGYFFSVIK